MKRSYNYLGCTTREEIQGAIEMGIDIRGKILHEMMVDDADDSERIINLYDEETREHQVILDAFCVSVCGSTLRDLIRNNVEVVMSFQIELSDYILRAITDPLEIIIDADETVIAMIDEFVVDLCGWTMSTLFQRKDRGAMSFHLPYYTNSH